jgi:hypothetical protein
MHQHRPISISLLVEIKLPRVSYVVFSNGGPVAFGALGLAKGRLTGRKELGGHVAVGGVHYYAARLRSHGVFLVLWVAWEVSGVLDQFPGAYQTVAEGSGRHDCDFN